MAWAGAAPSSWALLPHSTPPPTTPTLALGRLLKGRSWSQYPYLRDFLNTQPKEAPIANILSCMMLLSFAAFNPVCHYVRASQVALVVKNPPANAGDKRCGFDPWVGKIPWRRSWQPTAVFLPGESYGPRSLLGYSPWGHKESDTAEVTQQARTHVIM